MPAPSLAITYWSRRTGVRWWSQFDRGELREDLQRIAGIGPNAVRFCLTWEDVQPAPRKVNTALLRLFERALDVAGESGLGVIATLFPAAIGGALFVPRWVANPDLLNDVMRLGAVPPEAYIPQPTVVYEGVYRASRARELFRDTAAIEAMQYQIGEVVGYFGSHPAVRYWQLGEGLERVHRPAADDAVAAWFATMVETARAAHHSAQLLGVTSAPGLLQRGGPRPDQLAQICDLAGIALDAPLPLPEFRLHSPDAIEFFYTLASALAGTPLAALGLGVPTAPDGRAMLVADTGYGEPLTTALVSGQQQAEFLGRSLERLRGLGAPLVVLADYSDYPPSLWRDPPLDQGVRARTVGLMDASGREKADSVAALERWSATTPASAAQLKNLDAERYWHDPAQECARLWRAWIMER
ncbi:MAG: hypothetical protein H7Z42_12640 [Roseiflexaceae bacterium]|nr:hypothetical protein [Roseiflexaceae bacterium]